MRTPVVLALVGIAMLAIPPLVSPAYYVTLMLPFMAYGVVLLGLNLLFGYAGLVSFGHALFIGVGAYTGAVLTTHLGRAAHGADPARAARSPPPWWRRRWAPSACATSRSTSGC